MNKHSPKLMLSMLAARLCAELMLRSRPAMGDRISSAAASLRPCMMSSPCHHLESCSSV